MFFHLDWSWELSVPTLWPGSGGDELHLSVPSWSRNITKDKVSAHINPLCFINRLLGPVSGFSRLASHRDKTKGGAGQIINTAQCVQIGFHHCSIFNRGCSGWCLLWVCKSGARTPFVWLDDLWPLKDVGDAEAQIKILLGELQLLHCHSPSQLCSGQWKTFHPVGWTLPVISDVVRFRLSHLLSPCFLQPDDVHTSQIPCGSYVSLFCERWSRALPVQDPVRKSYIYHQHASFSEVGHNRGDVALENTVKVKVLFQSMEEIVFKLSNVKHDV